ncbi:TetR/AcrR family transcriptional regulator [Haloactinomyces albus]|uniref:AcrR family transcriptional regulator n=1 Tax=Haloactinomyces albus TaxID=1352928 RepID=A0AAE3ZBA9_9ACTN|nr:TetR/AcrR family transcriptional regulator [Haloactinomyces albus]MDR7300511.1 AcrR family transcriptional regulator [Haloactinomyces albus]
MPDDDAPELIWARPQRPGRGPQPTRSRSEIVAAAVEIADSDGLESVSIRRVASAVGLGTMSLYRYLSSKDDLVELMFDEICGEYVLPRAPSSDWKEDLHDLVRQGRLIMHRHPWTPRLVLERRGYGPNVLRVLESFLTALDAAGVDPAAMLEIYALINGFIASYVASELADEQERRRRSGTAEQHRAYLEPYLRSVVESGEYPVFARAVSASGKTADPDEQFERSIGRLLHGLVEAGG